MKETPPVDLFEKTRKRLRTLYPAMPEEDLDENTRKWIRAAKMMVRYAEQMDTFTQQTLFVIRQTRDISLPRFGNTEVKMKKGEAAHTVVTETDYAIEKFLSEEFHKIDPGIQFVGEEFGGDREAKRFWLVDPLDGTGLFVRGIPMCTTMVALIEDGLVTFSAIYNFVTDDLYHAVRGGGAFHNGEPIKVSDRDITQAYIGYESRIEKPENLAKYNEIRKQCSPLKFNCAGFEHIMVATGKMEARICFDPYGYDYDFAPGSLLIEEAGGVVANIGSTDYDYRNLNFIAANPKVFEGLTKGDDAIFPIH